MSLKKCFSALLFALATTSTLSAQYFENPSSFYLEAGIGFFPYLTYGPAVDSTLSGSSTSRFQLDLDAHLGWSVAGRLYVIGGYDGVLDEIFTNGIWVNEISSGLISLGFRLYPFGSGLILAADAGLSQLDEFVALGYGFGGTLAWDFSPMGLNLEVGARTIYLSFNYGSPSYMLAVMPFICLVMR